jgi:uncharacterized protein YbjT (DUF2867 family)
MSKQTIAVMGATGHVGAALSQLLLGRGHEVLALGRDARKLEALVAKGAKTRSVGFSDAAQLSEAFSGADAAFVMIPPSYDHADFRAYQVRTADAIAQALERARVARVVSLSSIGAQHPEGTGPIAGLHGLEQRLNRTALGVLHLRPGYFMENHLFSIATIKSMGMNGSPLRGDLDLPQIATQDIAAKAAEVLDGGGFRGSSSFEFAGPRDVTLAESTRILGQAIGQPGLQYVQFPYADAEKALAAMMPPSSASLLVEMYRALNEGLAQYEKPLAPERRTKTTLEEFATRTFAPAFRA